MQAALTELKRQFLPAQFDPTGTYADRWIARARAYRVLAHAEVEHFVEDRVTEVAKHALKEWKNSRKTTRPIVAMVAFCGRDMVYPPDTLAPPQPSAKVKHEEQLHLTERVNAASKNLFQSLKDNHGVKERNILRLLIPIGFLHSDLDPLWLVTMNSFGEARGEAAHLSAKLGTVSHPPDPKSEHELVKAVLVGLKDVDEKLTELMT
jgi:hypothetical protein